MSNWSDLGIITRKKRLIEHLKYCTPISKLAFNYFFFFWQCMVFLNYQLKSYHEWLNHGLGIMCRGRIREGEEAWHYLVQAHLYNICYITSNHSKHPTLLLNVSDLRINAYKCAECEIVIHLCGSFASLTYSGSLLR